MEPELDWLRGRVDELERRLAVVEGWVGLAAVVVPPPVMVPPPPIVVPEPVLVAAAVVSTVDGVETNAGLVWANRIGAITMILGVAFAFLYAVDNEMIGATGRRPGSPASRPSPRRRAG